MGSQVYFMMAPAVKMLKIGVTTDLESRLAAIQANSPVQLIVAATIPGDETVEQTMHRRFASARAHYEWFRLTPEIEKFIREIKAGVWACAAPPRYVEIYGPEGRVRATPEVFFGLARAIWGDISVSGCAKALGTSKRTILRWKNAGKDGRCIIPQTALRGLLRARDQYVATLARAREELRASIEEEEAMPR